MLFSIEEILKMIKLAYYEFNEFFDLDYDYNEEEFMKKGNETDVVYYQRLEKILIVLLKKLKYYYYDWNMYACWAEDILQKINK